MLTSLLDPQPTARLHQELRKPARQVQELAAGRKQAQATAGAEQEAVPSEAAISNQFIKLAAAPLHLIPDTGLDSSAVFPCNPTQTAAMEEETRGSEPTAMGLPSCAPQGPLKPQT